MERFKKLVNERINGGKLDLSNLELGNQCMAVVAKLLLLNNTITILVSTFTIFMLLEPTINPIHIPNSKLIIKICVDQNRILARIRLELKVVKIWLQALYTLSPWFI